MARPRLAGAVYALGVASLLTDLSSEMIYPLLPVFLAGTLGAGALSIGLIEGVAESTASWLKLVAGVVSDRTRRRKPLIVAGYGLAGVARPLVGLAQVWPVVLFIRFADRVGKGLRSSPRDALIADVTPPARRGTAFGVHRAMDHAGAVLGPLAAAALLRLGGVSMRHVFFLAAVPAALVLVVLIVAVREPPAPAGPPPARAPLGGWHELGRPCQRLLAAVFLFTLGNSTDALLLLRLNRAGVAASWIALLWSAHHVVKMAATYAGGRLADRIPRRAMLSAGWLVYAAVYVAFALVRPAPVLVGVFLAYGLYFGLSEPVEKAWIADLAPAERRGAAFGWYHAAIGLGALPASLIAGGLWAVGGPMPPFLVGAAFAVLATVLLRWRASVTP